MNHKKCTRTAAGRRARKQCVAAVTCLAWSGVFGAPLGAQLTLDGTNCVFFAEVYRGELARCVARRADMSTLKISLFGVAPNAVAEIRLSVDGKAPFQILDVDVQPTIDRQNVGLFITDMNFDTLTDFAVMRQASDGLDGSYVHFIFNPDSGLFETNLALASIKSPVFDHGTRRIISTWRGEAAMFIRDEYIWRGGEPILVKRRERDYSEPQCREITYEEVGGTLRLVNTQACVD